VDHSSVMKNIKSNSIYIRTLKIAKLNIIDNNLHQSVETVNYPALMYWTGHPRIATNTSSGDFDSLVPPAVEASSHVTVV